MLDGIKKFWLSKILSEDQPIPFYFSKGVVTVFGPVTQPENVAIKSIDNIDMVIFFMFQPVLRQYLRSREALRALPDRLYTLKTARELIPLSILMVLSTKIMELFPILR